MLMLIIIIIITIILLLLFSFHTNSQSYGKYQGWGVEGNSDNIEWEGRERKILKVEAWRKQKWGLKNGLKVLITLGV